MEFNGISLQAMEDVGTGRDRLALRRAGDDGTQDSLVTIFLWNLLT